MATEAIGYTDREQRDAEFWRLKEKGVKGLNRYTTHSDLPEPGEVIPDKWKGWNTSIIYVLAVPIETLPPEVAEAEEVLSQIEPEVPLTETESSDMMNEGGNTNELGEQPSDTFQAGFRGRVELAEPSDDSSERPDAPTDEDVI